MKIFKNESEDIMDSEAIYWHLPGIYYKLGMNHILFDAMEKYPEMFHENYKIGSVYGTFPSAIWNGGRTMLDGITKKSQVAHIIKTYNDRNIPVRFTWTNSLLEEKHVYDTYCNMIMEVGNNGMNQVLVNRDCLENYIRENYPDYKIISSTTKRILSADRLMEEFEKDYFLVVLDYDLNHDEKVLERLAPVADRVEILVNETCQPHCPQRAAHYREMSKCQLEFDVSPKLQFFCQDQTPDKRTFRGCMKRPAFLSTADVEEYVKKGFRNFKLVGRGLDLAFYLDSLMYYMVKPEHREFISQYFVDTFNKMNNRPKK